MEEIDELNQKTETEYSKTSNAKTEAFSLEKKNVHEKENRSRKKAKTNPFGKSLYGKPKSKNSNIEPKIPKYPKPQKSYKTLKSQ